jgi:hypothetical protein
MAACLIPIGKGGIAAGKSVLLPMLLYSGCSLPRLLTPSYRNTAARRAWLLQHIQNERVSVREGPRRDVRRRCRQEPSPISSTLRQNAMDWRIVRWPPKMRKRGY